MFQAQVLNQICDFKLLSPSPPLVFFMPLKSDFQGEVIFECHEVQFIIFSFEKAIFKRVYNYILAFFFNTSEYYFTLFVCTYNVSNEKSVLKLNIIPLYISCFIPIF